MRKLLDREEDDFVVYNEIRICPDCGEELFYDRFLKVWTHLEFQGQKDCYYAEDIDGYRQYDNTCVGKPKPVYKVK